MSAKCDMGVPPTPEVNREYIRLGVCTEEQYQKALMRNEAARLYATECASRPKATKESLGYHSPYWGDVERLNLKPLNLISSRLCDNACD